MNARALENNEKKRKDLAKRAVALAMKNRWDDAAKVNRSILTLFPNDIEAYNRLGKALSELGRNREARTAFEAVRSRSPNNPIAKKNLARLAKLADDEAPKMARRSNRGVQFLEDSGKAGVTALVKLAPPAVLRKLTPGDLVRLVAKGVGLTVADEFQTYVGQVEPRVGARIARLMRGGNRYEATVRSAEDDALVVIIRETYKSPSQARNVSFPTRAGDDYRVYVPSVAAAYDEDDAPPAALGDVAAVKDWSNDDTEPGDDDVFDDSSAGTFRIIDPAIVGLEAVGDGC